MYLKFIFINYYDIYISILLKKNFTIGLRACSFKSDQKFQEQKENSNESLCDMCTCIDYVRLFIQNGDIIASRFFSCLIFMRVRVIR